MDIDLLITNVQTLATTFGIRLIAAIAVLVIGWWVAKMLTRGAARLMQRGNVDPMLERFLSRLCYAALMTAVVLAAISQLGIETASLLAVVGAAGLAIGLALQGSLSNFAAGVLIILFRPYRVGHYIEAAGTAGTVEDVQIFTTVLNTPDNKRIIIPNSAVMNGTITNYTVNDKRRIDLVFGVSYSDDIDRVRGLLDELIAADARILPEPAPLVRVVQLADSSVNFAVRPWVKTDDYWAVYFDLTEGVKKRFDAERVSIPFPQRDIHLYQQPSQ